MTTKHQTLLLTVALAMSALAISTAGCSSDPNGSTATGGSGAGGNAGTGGTTTAGGPIVGMALATFATDIEMFKMNDYNDAMSKNLYAGTPSVPTFSSTEGSPDPGSITVTAAYTGYAQYVEFLKDFGATAPQNWSGKTKLHVRVKVASGFNLDPSNPGGAIVSVQSYTPAAGATAEVWSYSQGVYSNVAMGSGWQEFTWTAPTIPPVGFDMTKIRLMGVQLTTGTGGGTMTPGPAVFYVDSWSIE